MATTFLEPGGDATFNANVASLGGLWRSSFSTTLATDFVHGSHQKSVKIKSSDVVGVEPPANTIANSGTRMSVYLYIVALPTGTKDTILDVQTDAADSFNIYITSTGVLQLWNNATTQIGKDGAALSAGRWYRICLAYTITNGSVNRFELFVNGVPSISVTNATITNATATRPIFFGLSSDAAFDFRLSDFYFDNSSSLKDTGDVWVTAKRPFTNGTTNGFTTQIGAGGSGYGSGHTPQVNERPASTTNGWSMVGAGAAVVEEYNVEGNSAGDIYVNKAKVIDLVGWVYTSSLVGETINIILNGVNFSQAITSTNTVYQKVAGYAGYLAGSGADIGIQTDTSLTTVSLFECGVLVAFIPDTNTFGNYAPYLRSGNMSRSERAT